VAASDLAHLPSLRNQFGQGHVNADLTSLAWLAAPPYSFGYHTGVLRLDGAILPAQRFRWKPWGVQREHASARMTVRTDTRMALEQDLLLWQIEVTNNTEDPIDATLSRICTRWSPGPIPAGDGSTTFPGPPATTTTS